MASRLTELGQRFLRFARAPEIEAGPAALRKTPASRAAARLLRGPGPEGGTTIGTRISIYTPALPSGRPWKLPAPGRRRSIEMQAKAIGAPGKTSPAIFAFLLSKASTPELHQKNMAHPNPQNQNPLRRILTRGFWRSADFFGASSVASALDLRRGRDPVTDPSQPSSGVTPDCSKPELSTLR